MLENNTIFVHSLKTALPLTNDLAKPKAVEPCPLTSGAIALGTRSAVIGFILVGILLGIILALQLQVSDPYVKTVLTLDGDSVRGHAIFQMNCAGCHGIQNGRQVGPSLTGVSQRKSPVGIINQVTGGKTPPMPQFQPNPQDMADLLKYVQSL
ncbi:c-type cytochrome [Laspinema olomoucense]|uniref:c-type cytochrome n=1 Tax=Laspinema olomoucense TaxID=3231600 RepID=UPI0021BB1141|nr:cytochrome c [Laspinema sp. D3c]MCT7995275.1 cytochrome c [Laspinema sp. D3c]